MNFDSTLQSTINDSSNLPEGLSAADIAALSNYPSLAKLFDASDLTELNQMQNRLRGTFQALERVVLRGSNEDAKQAKSAAAAFKITLDFIEVIKQMKTNAHGA